ncbi:nucleic acid-binding, OB-fold protein [Tanacetum coccineum]
MDNAYSKLALKFIDMKQLQSIQLSMDIYVAVIELSNLLSKKCQTDLFYYFFSLLIITELDVILPICDPIGNQRQSPITYGGEPPTSICTIKSLCDCKSKLRPYNNAKGDGKVFFPFDLPDATVEHLLIITELDVILPICDPIGNQRQSPITYGGEPPTSMYAPPVQSINQPTTMANPQNLTGSSHPGSVPRPNITANSPIYPHNQDHRAGLHSYEEKLGTSEKADWITVSGNVGFLKVDSFYYTACPLTINDRKCNKKATNNGDGKWRCDRCDKDVDECDYRYILQFQIQDHTGITWVTAFEKGGEAIMGVTAKEETFNDDSRVKITVTKAEKINFSSETSFLLDMLKKDHPSSLVPMIEMPPAGSGRTPTGNFAYKESAPFSNYMGNASGVGRQSATLPASQMGQYGNQYRGSSRLNTSCNSCGVGQNSGHRANDYTGVSNAVSAYGRGNAAQGRYGSASGQYVGMEDDESWLSGNQERYGSIFGGTINFPILDITDHSSEKLRIKMCPTRLRAYVVTVLTEKAALLLPQYRTDEFRIRQIKSTYKVNHVLSEIEALVYMNWQMWWPVGHLYGRKWSHFSDKPSVIKQHNQFSIC